MPTVPSKPADVVTYDNVDALDPDARYRALRITNLRTGAAQMFATCSGRSAALMFANSTEPGRLVFRKEA